MLGLPNFKKTPEGIPIARPVSAPFNAPQVRATEPKAEPATTPAQAFAEAPRRIKRLRFLAMEGASGNAQIENEKINGLWARAFCKLYDSRPGIRHELETLPMHTVFTKVNKLLDKGLI